MKTNHSKTSQPVATNLSRKFATASPRKAKRLSHAFLAWIAKGNGLAMITGYFSTAAITQRLLALLSIIMPFTVTAALAQVGQEGDPFAFEDLQLRDEVSAPKRSVSYEFRNTFTYIGDMEMEQGNASFGDVDTFHNQTTFVASPAVADGFLLRFGADYSRYSFGLPSQAPIPNTLQNLNAIVGFDWSITDRWLMRFELQPGFYNTNSDFRTNDINVPIVIGASYFQSPELQWIVGMSVDFWREIPVLPAVGVRWQFADDWVLNAIVPRPRLEYKITEGLDAFIGAELAGGTYRSSVDHGNSHGNAKLNDTPISYSEVRVGGGVIWQLNKALSVNVNGGWVPYRRLDFHRANTQFDKADEGAPYAQISITGRF